MKKRQKSPERDMQVAFFEEVAWRANTDWRWGMILSYPLQRGNDVVWLKMRLQEGASKGFPDIAVLLPVGDYNGLFIELKAGRNKPTEHQIDWCKKLNQAGYLACVLYATSADDIVRLVTNYLESGSIFEDSKSKVIH